MPVCFKFKVAFTWSLGFKVTCKFASKIDLKSVPGLWLWIILKATFASAIIYVSYDFLTAGKSTTRHGAGVCFSCGKMLNVSLIFFGLSFIMKTKTFRQRFIYDVHLKIHKALWPACARKYMFFENFRHHQIEFKRLFGSLLLLGFGIIPIQLAV